VETRRDDIVERTAAKQKARQGTDVFGEDRSLQARGRGRQIDRRQELGFGHVDALRGSFSPMHCRGEIGPVRKQLYREMRRKLDICRNVYCLPSKQVLCRIGTMTHQPGEQILLHDQKPARTGLEPDRIFEFEARLHDGVGGTESRPESRLRHIQRFTPDINHTLSQCELLRECCPANIGPSDCGG
jgi:hypothetical protein